MGRYGFDLDGTLDSCPELAHLARALALAGHKIWIITGSSFSHKAIEAKLYGLNVVDYQKVIKVDGVSDIEIGKAKGEECNKHKIDVYFDNDPEVLKGFASVCKAARVYILNGDILQPRIAPVPKRNLWCRCMIEMEEWYPTRCMHCTEFFESAQQERDHISVHHILESPDGSLCI